MILFYSDFCPHCRMLLDTIKRHDSKGMVKLACIENLRAKGTPIPSNVHSVPALLLLPSKKILFGKQVFDHLLLPGSGKLLVGVSPSPGGQGDTQVDEAKNAPSFSEPMAYSIQMSGGSDKFSMIEESNHPMQGLDDRSYNWTGIQGNTPEPTVFANAPFQEETRSKKGLPDLDSYRAQREMDLKQSDLNTNQLLPPTFTR